MAIPPRLAPVMRRGNQLALKVSSRVPPWATIHHIGRTSGREYRTPVLAFAVRAPIDPSATDAPGPVTAAQDRDILVVHVLPWGTDVDWCRNIRATGWYTLTRKSVDYRVDQIRVVDAADHDPVLDGFGPRTAHAVGVTKFLIGRLRPARGSGAERA